MRKLYKPIHEYIELTIQQKEVWWYMDGILDGIIWYLRGCTKVWLECVVFHEVMEKVGLRRELAHNRSEWQSVIHEKRLNRASVDNMID